MSVARRDKNPAPITHRELSDEEQKCKKAIKLSPGMDRCRSSAWRPVWRPVCTKGLPQSSSAAGLRRDVREHAWVGETEQANEQELQCTATRVSGGGRGLV